MSLKVAAGRGRNGFLGGGPDRLDVVGGSPDGGTGKGRGVKLDKLEGPNALGPLSEEDGYPKGG